MLRLMIKACWSFVAALALAGCVASEDQQLGTTEQELSQTATGYPVKVYFSKFNDSLNNASLTFAVDRASPTTGLATYAIQSLIAGPTTEERGLGYFSELNSILSGASNCAAPWPTAGPDFKVTLNKKGTVTETGTATLQLCRTSSSSGSGTDARILAEVNATLKQFSNITKVVMLTKAGHCFGDLSGTDPCLK